MLEKSINSSHPPLLRQGMYRSIAESALGHSNEIHCFSSPARMLEWILGLELIIHYFGASSCVIELLASLCKFPARPGPYMTLYGLSTSYNRFVLPLSSPCD